MDEDGDGPLGGEGKTVEADETFCYSHRSALGIEDPERATLAIKGAAGKRLVYKQPRSAA